MQGDRPAVREGQVPTLPPSGPLTLLKLPCSYRFLVNRRTNFQSTVPLILFVRRPRSAGCSSGSSALTWYAPSPDNFNIKGTLSFSSEKRTTHKVSRTFTCKPRPESGRAVSCRYQPLVHGNSTPHMKVDVSLPGNGNSNFHGARPVHQTISMIQWTRTRRLSIKRSLQRPPMQVPALDFCTYRMRGIGVPRS